MAVLPMTGARSFPLFSGVAVAGAGRFKSYLAAATLTAVLASAPLQGTAQAGENWPSKVDAEYAIDFNGFNIGSFTLQSSVHGKTYVLSGQARVSALLGFVKWQGLTRTAGKVAGVMPKPAGYTFDYRSGKRGGSVKIGFSGSKVRNVSAIPPTPVGGTIPLKPHHLEKVLDPLSAVMAMTKARGSDPCAKRLRVFDGRQRFDLVLSYAGKQRLPSGGSRGSASNVGYVCQVRYQPIAGYQPNAQTKAMARSRAIKIILRPIPGARLLVPHKIVVPTGVGTATLTAKRVNVTTRGLEEIALVH